MIDTSIIIPVYNNSNRIRIVLDKLVIQSYPKNSYEIIVCDNGSTDSTPQVVQKYCKRYPDLVRIVIEDKIHSSYAARNRGIKNALGEILAFTDSDCIPEINWLFEGVKALRKNDASCGGGRISFFFKSEIPNIYEHFDAGRKLNQEAFVKKSGFAATANFFVQKKTFDSYGLFRNDLISGGDYEFGQRITSANEKMIYIHDAEVKHPARANLRAILKKSRRIAKGEKQLQNLGLYENRKVSWRQLLPVKSCVAASGWENRVSIFNKISIIALYTLVRWVNFFIRKF